MRAGAVLAQLGSLRLSWRAWAADVARLVYPTACAGCEAPVDEHAAGAPLCVVCREKFAPLRVATACPRCAAPLPDPEQPCGRCNGAGVRPFRAIARLCVFDEPVREMVHHLKYHGQWWLAAWLADQLAAKPDVRRLVERADVIVPVPLHFWRQWQRGFNQAQLVAAPLANSQRKPLCRALIRIKATAKQSLQDSRAARARNLKEAFAIRSDRAMRSLHDKHVLLVDDVMTTGATLRAAARALRPAKPASVSAVVLAAADPKGRDFAVL
jgi:ComF family protein